MTAEAPSASSSRLPGRLLRPALAGACVFLVLLTLADLPQARAGSWALLAVTLVAAAELVPAAVRRLLGRGGRFAGAGLQRRLARLFRALGRAVTLRLLFALAAGAAAFRWAARVRPFPGAGDDPLLDFIALHDPAAHAFFHAWHLAAPGVVAFGSVLLLSGAARVWLGSRTESAHRGRGVLPPWPTSASDDAPSLVLGELHHPVDDAEAARPRWLAIPERGLYTGVAIFGAVGTGKTSGCMRPFAEQLFSWQADDPQRRAAGLVLEVKGDFCHDVRQLLAEAGREDDYVELALGGRWQWNPLDSHMDSYSLAYSLATLLNQPLRPRKGPLLAAGVHQPGPLDHRTAPRLPRPLDHAARRLPPHHRSQGLPGQDRSGARALRPPRLRAADPDPRPGRGVHHEFPVHPGNAPSPTRTDPL